MWFQVELPEAAALTGLILDATQSAGDYPKGYMVELSQDGKDWQRVAIGNGSPEKTNIAFEPQPARYIKITQLGERGGFWSIHELHLFTTK